MRYQGNEVKKMKYTVLFRGINVGGKNVVKMNDLRQFLLDLGLQKVKTYVQSGNAIFESELDETSLQRTIYTGFFVHFGFQCDIRIRGIDEIRFLIAQLPIAADEIAAAVTADPQIEHLYVYFLGNQPEQSQIDLVCKAYTGPDILRAGKRELYLLCHESIRKSKLAAGVSKIYPSATARNWNTICNLFDMLSDL